MRKGEYNKGEGVITWMRENRSVMSEEAEREGGRTIGRQGEDREGGRQGVDREGDREYRS